MTFGFWQVQAQSGKMRNAILQYTAIQCDTFAYSADPGRQQGGARQGREVATTAIQQQQQQEAPDNSNSNSNALPFAGGSGPLDLGPAPLRLGTCTTSWTKGCLVTQAGALPFV